MFSTAIQNNCCPYTHIQNYFLILSDLFLDMLAFKITEFNFTHTLKLYSNRRHIEDKSCSWHQAQSNKIELWQNKATEILTQQCRCYCTITHRCKHEYIVLLYGVITDSWQFPLTVRALLYQCSPRAWHSSSGRWQTVVVTKDNNPILYISGYD